MVLTAAYTGLRWSGLVGLPWTRVAGDVLGPLRCLCATQLITALAAIERAGRGVLVYLRSRIDG